MKYAVKQKYYDNGHISVVLFSVEDDHIPPEVKYTKRYDEYIDIFQTRQEAQRCLYEARNA